MSAKVMLAVRLYPLWLEISLSHLRASQAAQLRLSAAHEARDDKDKADALESEFSHGMQSIVAAATAIDAFYATIKPLAGDEIEGQEERRKRSTRYLQVKETIRRVFKVGPKSVRNLDNLLEQVYRWRGWAVHPLAKPREAVFHEGIQAGVEWRFVAFSSSCAKDILRATLSMLYQLSRLADEDSDERVKKFGHECGSALAPVIADWEAEHGPLVPPNDN